MAGIETTAGVEVGGGLRAMPLVLMVVRMFGSSTREDNFGLGLPMKELFSLSTRLISVLVSLPSLLSFRFTIDGTELHFRLDNDEALELALIGLDLISSLTEPVESASLPDFFLPFVETSSALFCLVRKL